MTMRVGAVLSPVADVPSVVRAAVLADEAGLDAVGLWDHYHSGRPEWAYACGWSVFGSIAARTSRVRLVPMVLNNLHYELGVLAKESSMLSLASDGRFELGIGAGDWPASFSAWGRPFPPQAERLGRLESNVAALRLLWTGAPVTLSSEWVQLVDAICTPAPAVQVRVVIGAGGSARTLESAVRVADEVNVYADEAVIDRARRAVQAQPRPVDLSVFVSWEWDKWPADVGRELDRLAARGVDRVFVSLGSGDMPARISELAAWARPNPAER